MVQLRVATWNMDNWKQPAGRRRQAWAWLEDQLAPDIALLQETIPPNGTERAIWKEGGIDEKRRWASAVASFGPTIEEVRHAKGRYHKQARDLHQSQPGILAIGRVSLPEAEPVTVVSAYGLLDDGYATSTVHRILTDLLPLLDSPEGDRLILGGDLNCSTQFDPPYRQVHENLFDRFEVHGLVDLAKLTKDERPSLKDCWCADAPECSHVKTHDHNRSNRPWNIDYLFASQSLAQQLVSFEVVDAGEPSPWSFSDHCPLLATFEL